MKEKYCGTCKKNKRLNQFNKNKSKSDGLSTICRECSKEHSKNYYKENGEKLRKKINISNRKRAIENKIKLYNYYLIHPCIDCGENDPVVLELDHVRGRKTSIVSKLVNQGFSWERVLNEINKCDVRCANCHRRKTAKDFNWYKYINLSKH